MVWVNWGQGRRSTKINMLLFGRFVGRAFGGLFWYEGHCRIKSIRAFKGEGFLNAMS